MFLSMYSNDVHVRGWEPFPDFHWSIMTSRRLELFSHSSSFFCWLLLRVIPVADISTSWFSAKGVRMSIPAINPRSRIESMFNWLPNGDTVKIGILLATHYYSEAWPAHGISNLGRGYIAIANPHLWIKLVHLPIFIFAPLAACDAFLKTSFTPSRVNAEHSK